MISSAVPGSTIPREQLERQLRKFNATRAASGDAPNPYPAVTRVQNEHEEFARTIDNTLGRNLGEIHDALSDSIQAKDATRARQLRAARIQTAIGVGALVAWQVGFLFPHTRIPGQFWAMPVGMVLTIRGFKEMNRLQNPHLQQQYGVEKRSLVELENWGQILSSGPAAGTKAS